MSDKVKKIAILVGAILFAVIVIAGALYVASGVKNNKIIKQLSVANQYLDDGEYDKAIAAFDEVLSIDPKCVDAYLGQANAYVGLGDEAAKLGDYEKAEGFYKDAIEVLTDGLDATNDESLNDRIDEIKELIDALSLREEEAPVTDAIEDHTGSGISSIPPVYFGEFKVFELTLETITHISVDEMRAIAQNNYGAIYSVNGNPDEDYYCSVEGSSTNNFSNDHCFDNTFYYFNGGLSYYTDTYVTSDDVRHSGHMVGIYDEGITIDYQCDRWSEYCKFPVGFPANQPREVVEQYLIDNGCSYTVSDNSNGSYHISWDLGMYDSASYGTLTFMYNEPSVYDLDGEEITLYTYDGIWFSDPK